MKKDRNCGMMPMMPIQGMIGYPYQEMINIPNQSYNYQNNDLSNITNKLNNLEQRINRLENIINNGSNYNSANYQMM